MLFWRRLLPNEAWLLVCLDGRLVQGLRHLRQYGPAAAHCGVVVRPVRHRVRLLAAEEGQQGPVLVRHALPKHPLEALKRVASHGVEPPDLPHSQILRPVHVIRPQVPLDGSDDGPERVLDTVAQARVPGVEPLPLGMSQQVKHEDQGEQQLGHVVRVHVESAVACTNRLHILSKQIAN